MSDIDSLLQDHGRPLPTDGDFEGQCSRGVYEAGLSDSGLQAIGLTGKGAERLLVIEWRLTVDEQGFFRLLSDGGKVRADDEEIRKFLFDRSEVDKDGYYLYPSTYQFSHPMSVRDSDASWRSVGPLGWRPAITPWDYGQLVCHRLNQLLGFLRAHHMFPGLSDRYSIRQRHAIGRHIHQVAEELNSVGFGWRLIRSFRKSDSAAPDSGASLPESVTYLPDLLPFVLDGIRARQAPRRRAA
jgi:hypothetical protein